MMRTCLAALTAVLVLVACSGQQSTETASTDASEVDLAVADAREAGDDPGAPLDTASPEADAEDSQGDTPEDGTLVGDDTDVPPADTGAPDADTVAPDADTVAPDDAAEPSDLAEPQDTAPTDLVAPEIGDGDASADTDPGPVGDNVLAQGSFEAWADGLPIGWVGPATNLASSGIAEETSLAHDGVRSCRLVNPNDSHKRFSTEPMALQAGKYSCRYWVRGDGEIRNARYNGDYSSYSGYTTIAGDVWEPIDYAFNLASDAAAFELIFSVRATSDAGLVIDDVRCVRGEQACDTVTCDAWQVCKNPEGTCVSAPGKCADDGECASWQTCGADHDCGLAPGACASTADCQGETPVCDQGSHLCVAGDPCADVSCNEWQVCEPSDASCVTAEGRCVGLADCALALPACDLATHTCVAVDAPVNVVPNGGFEAWSTVILGTSTEFLLPDFWYGVCDGCSPYWPTTEIDANNVKPYTAAPHGGTTALQLIDSAAPAERFVSEPFTVTPGVSYSCAYWVRGHGTYRQRGYCGAWNVDTDYQPIDSDEWHQVTFKLGGNTSWCVLILYASTTNADRDHLQFDDVVCIAP